MHRQPGLPEPQRQHVDPLRAQPARGLIGCQRGRYGHDASPELAATDSATKSRPVSAPAKVPLPRKKFVYDTWNTALSAETGPGGEQWGTVNRGRCQIGCRSGVRVTDC